MKILWFSRHVFQSPHGDKFQRFLGKRLYVLTDKFPSPHGDKFQVHGLLLLLTPSRFRPLTGINFNPLSKITRADLQAVSVPSQE